jgi:hypothetical protein
MERGREHEPAAQIPNHPQEHDMQAQQDDSDNDQDWDILHPHAVAFDPAREWPFDGQVQVPNGPIEDAMEEEHPAPGDRHLRMWNLRENLGGLCVPL